MKVKKLCKHGVNLILSALLLPLTIGMVLAFVMMLATVLLFPEVALGMFILMLIFMIPCYIVSKIVK